MSATLPVWDRLIPAGRRLRVEPPRQLRWPLAEVVDGDLAGADGAASPDAARAAGATIFDAWREADAWRLQAAAVLDDRVATFDVHAERLRLRRADPAMLRLLEIDRQRPPPGVELDDEATPAPVEPRLVCSCRAVGDDAVVRAIGAGWWTADAVKRRTRVAFGECQGRRCLPGLAERLELDPGDPLGLVTPRPPLVPVPASVLAVFAASPEQARRAASRLGLES